MGEDRTEETWAVTAIAREAPEVIQRFVAWHLDQGAAHIYLYFDDPGDPCIEMVSHLEQVSAVPCTPEFWTELGLTQETRFTKRQNHACRHGYDQVSNGWVLNVDADELLWIETGSIGAFLAEQAPDCRAVLFEPAELVLIDGDEGQPAFRSKTPRPVLRRTYGDIANIIRRNDGLVGHNVGKSATRAGLKRFWLRQHYGQLRSGEQITDRIVSPAEGAAILHFFSRGYDDWRRKLDYRLTNRGFRPKMRRALEAARDEGEDALRAIYAELHYLSQDQAKSLQDGGCLNYYDLGITEKIARYFPKAQMK